MIVLPDGSVEASTLKVVGTGDGQFEIKMLEWFTKKQKWTAGTVGGCAVVSRAGVRVVALELPGKSEPTRRR